MDETLKLLGIDTRGVKYDDMNEAERATLNSWIDSVKQEQLSVIDIKGYIQRLRSDVEEELYKTPETKRVWLFFTVANRDAILLKARLRNYMLLEDFLSGPDKARKAVERNLQRLS